ncbi:MAG: histone deacetylase [Calditrichia bacterium]
MRFFRKKRCKIVYRSEYFSGIQARDSRATFDVMKFKKIRDQLIRERLIKRRDILPAPRITNEDILLVHTPEYLATLKNPLLVGEILNLDYVNPWDEYIFEYFRFVTGGTLLSAQYALEHNTTVFNLGGGFHHAHPERGEGFCLINDVAIAIQKLKLLKNLDHFLIVDLDYHQGNGNLLYFKDDDSVFTFSIHAENWVESSGKTRNIDIELPAHANDELYLNVLKEKLPVVFEGFHPEIAFYLAGSDPYVYDTLGDFDLSEEGLLERDIFVYRQIREREIPLVILGAGGYGPESWKIYFNFIRWVIKRG